MNGQGRHLANSENCPMPGKIPGAKTDAFNPLGLINTWPQIDHSGHQEGSNIMGSAPWQEEVLFLSYHEGMTCNSLPN